MNASILFCLSFSISSYLQENFIVLSYTFSTEFSYIYNFFRLFLTIFKQYKTKQNNKTQNKSFLVTTQATRDTYTLRPLLRIIRDPVPVQSLSSLLDWNPEPCARVLPLNCYPRPRIWPDLNLDISSVSWGLSFRAEEKTVRLRLYLSLKVGQRSHPLKNRVQINKKQTKSSGINKNKAGSYYQVSP